MWYAICLGVGLFIGISFLIWGLVERSKRHAAELSEKAALIDAATMRSRLLAEEAFGKSLKDRLKSLDVQNDQLRTVLEGCRIQLRTSKDPATIKKWLDYELQGKKIL